MLVNKKIILFDWDDTLFSKTEYKKRLSTALAKICKISEDDAWKMEEEYFNSLNRSGDFRVDKFLKFVGQKSGIEINLDYLIKNNLDIYSGSVFPESADVLNQLKNNFVLGIYSQGFKDLQSTKIELSGIKFFFNEKFIYINSNKLDSEFIKTLPNQAIVIDDKKEVIEALKYKRPDLGLIWINRIDDEIMEGVKTIKSLKELV